LVKVCAQSFQSPCVRYFICMHMYVCMGPLFIFICMYVCICILNFGNIYVCMEALTTKRFRKLFDYYSVGLLLLEIGIWRTAKSMSDAHPLHSPEALRTEFVTRYIPELPYSMGEIYYRATKACLMGEIGTIDTPEEDVVTAFQTLVVDRLQTCVV